MDWIGEDEDDESLCEREASVTEILEKLLKTKEAEEKVGDFLIYSADF